MGFLDSINEIKNKISYEKLVKVEGIEITLGLISVEQETLVNSLIEESSTSEEGLYYFNELRKRILSYSITKIGGDTIPDVVEYDDNGNPAKKEKNLFLYDFVRTLPNLVIDRLFEAYTDLKDEVEDSINDKIYVNWYLSPEEREKRRAAEIEEARIAQEKLNEMQEPEGKEAMNFREIKVDKEPEEEKEEEKQEESE